MASKEKRNTYRKSAIIVGLLYILGTVAGVAGGVISEPILGDADYLALVAVNESKIVTGALLVLVMGFALVMVPVVMFPIFRRVNEVLALAAVVFRGVLEAFCYMALAISMLLLISLSLEYVDAGAPNDAYFQSASALLVELGDWIELVLAIVFSLGALILYYLFYRSKLVPRWLSGWGFVGAILYFAAAILVIYNAQDLVLSLTTGVGILLAPLAIQEMVFGLWLIVKGFNPSAIDALFAE